MAHQGGTRSRNSARRQSRLSHERDVPRRLNRRRRQRRSHTPSALPLAVVFIVLVGINIYVFFFRGGTSIRDVMKASAIARSSRQAQLKPHPSSRTDSPGIVATAPVAAEGVRSVRGSMRGRAGLLAALEAYAVPQSQALHISQALQPYLDLRALRPEHEFELVINPALGVTRFAYYRSPLGAIVLQRQPDGSFAALSNDASLRQTTGGMAR